MATSRVLPLEGDYYRSQRISIASVYVLPYFYHLSLDVRGKLEIHRELVSVASQRASLMFFAGSKGAINRRVGRELGILDRCDILDFVESHLRLRKLWAIGA